MDHQSIRTTYVDMNSEAHLPVDGGRTNIPHWHIAREGDRVVGVMIVSTRWIVDLVYVDRDMRGRGIAGALLASARHQHGKAVGTDDRLTVSGVAWARHYRVPFYGADRREATVEPEVVEGTGQAALERATRILAVDVVAA
jgi:GNAT superfamily N-acetyltransferase